MSQRRMALVHLSQDLELLLDGHSGRMLEREQGQLGGHVLALKPCELDKHRVEHVRDLAQHLGRGANLLFRPPLARRARGAHGSGRVVHFVDLHLVPRGARLAGLLRRGRGAEVVHVAGLAVELVDDVPELLVDVGVELDDVRLVTMASSSTLRPRSFTFSSIASLVIAGRGGSGPEASFGDGPIGSKTMAFTSSSVISLVNGGSESVKSWTFPTSGHCVRTVVRAMAASTGVAVSLGTSGRESSAMFVHRLFVSRRQ